MGFVGTGHTCVCMCTCAVEHLSFMYCIFLGVWYYECGVVAGIAVVLSPSVEM